MAVVSPHDCFSSVGSALLSLESALEKIRHDVPSVVARQEVSLLSAAEAQRAVGMVLARDVVAAVTVPPCDNSAMDGYAFRFADVAAAEEGRLWPVVRRIVAGDPPGEPLPIGGVVRIFTGAPLPPGADTVAMQEDCEAVGDTVRLPSYLKRPGALGANRRLAGEDFSQGSVVLSAGRRLRGQDLAMAAAAGATSLQVFEPLKVAVFSTGDELCPLGEERPAAGKIFDSNRYGVCGALQSLGCAVTDLGLLPDAPQAICQALAAAAPGHHLLVTSGGVSVGDEDHVKAAVEALGSLSFWRLAVKPGKPVALGYVAGTAFLGLPGNPVAALVSLLLVGRPLVAALSGRTHLPLRRYRLPVAFTFRKKAGRQEFLRGWVETSATGQTVVQRFAAQGSGVLSSLVQAEGLIDVAAEVTAVAEGDLVDYWPLQEMMW